MTHQTSVLIVDDNADYCSILSKILVKKGYATAIAENGQRAVEMVRERSFGVILMDVKMPVMNGVDAYKKIKEIRPSEIVIFMTAFSLEDLVKETTGKGAYALIQKPFDMETVLRMIEKSSSGAFLTVIDDDPNMGVTMQHVLEKKGYSMAICLTGEEAIALAKERPRDIFFIDMKLPVLNGLETYLEIKKVNPKAVVVMMTAYRQEMDEMVKQAMEKGAYACLNKPFDMDEVIRIIEEIAERKSE